MVSVLDIPLWEEVTVIVPAYNEGNSIKQTLEEVRAYESLSGVELIVVDDGSIDDTFEQASAVADVKVLKHPNNKGYGNAIATGTRHVTTQYIAWYDADAQHRPEDLARIIHEIKNKNLDYCIGVRGRDSHVEKSRVAGKFLLGLILSLILTEKIDYNSGLRIFKSDILNSFLSSLPKRFGASTVSTLIMQESNFAGGTVPIVVRQRIGKSSVRQVRDGVYTILLAFNVILMFRPLQVFGAVGITSMLFGTVYGLYIALTQEHGIPILAAVLIFFGLQLFVFGIIAHLIAQVRRDLLEKKISPNLSVQKNDNKILY